MKNSNKTSNIEKNPIIRDRHFYEVLDKMNELTKIFNGKPFWDKEELMEMSNAVDDSGNGVGTGYFVFRKTKQFLFIKPSQEFKLRLVSSVKRK